MRVDDMVFPLQRSSVAAFTLLEVLLAIVIAVGLLLVALTFHHQATDLRNQVVQETERIGVMRLVLDRMTMELRACRADDWQGFVGTSNSVQFVSLGQVPLGPVRAPSTNTTSNSSASRSDLKVITYELMLGIESTNVASLGINRKEEARGPAAAVSTNAAEMAAVSFAADTNLTGAVTNRFPEPFTDVIKQLQFRYWDGAAWADAWSDIVPPKGIEITVSSETSTIDEAETEIFRRVVFIPAGASKVSETLPGFPLLP